MLLSILLLFNFKLIVLFDFIYVWRYNGIPEEKIAADVSGWAKKVAKEKLRAYAKKYPKTVAEIATRVAK